MQQKREREEERWREKRGEWRAESGERRERKQSNKSTIDQFYLFVAFCERENKGVFKIITFKL